MVLARECTWELVIFQESTYLFSFIVGCLLSLFYGPVVEHEVADVVGDVAIFLSGLVLGLAFFTDALRTGGVRAEPITGANAG